MQQHPIDTRDIHNQVEVLKALYNAKEKGPLPSSLIIPETEIHIRGSIKDLAQEFKTNTTFNLHYQRAQFLLDQAMNSAEKKLLRDAFHSAANTLIEDGFITRTTLEKGRFGRENLLLLDVPVYQITEAGKADVEQHLIF